MEQRDIIDYVAEKIGSDDMRKIIQYIERTELSVILLDMRSTKNEDKAERPSS